MKLKRILIYALFLVLVIPFISCSQKTDEPSVVFENSSSYSASVRAGSFAPGQLEAHYLKHGNQFGSITQEQYLENAREFLDAPQGKDILQKTRSNGDILHYRPSTGEFAVMTRTGRIRTYFKADYRYWLKE